MVLYQAMHSEGNFRNVQLLEHWKTKNQSFLTGFCGADTRIRTGDLILTNALMQATVVHVYDACACKSFFWGCTFAWNASDAHCWTFRSGILISRQLAKLRMDLPCVSSGCEKYFQAKMHYSASWPENILTKLVNVLCRFQVGLFYLIKWTILEVSKISKSCRTVW